LLTPAGISRSQNPEVRPLQKQGRKSIHFLWRGLTSIRVRSGYVETHSLECYAKVSVGAVEEVLVELLDPPYLRSQSGQGLPKDHEVDKLLAQAPLGRGECELVCIEVPTVLKANGEYDTI